METISLVTSLNLKVHPSLSCYTTIVFATLEMGRGRDPLTSGQTLIKPSLHVRKLSSVIIRQSQYLVPAVYYCLVHAVYYCLVHAVYYCLVHAVYYCLVFAVHGGLCVMCVMCVCESVKVTLESIQTGIQLAANYRTKRFSP